MQAQESQRLLDIEIGSVWSMAAESGVHRFLFSPSQQCFCLAGAVDVSKSEPAVCPFSCAALPIFLQNKVTIFDSEHSFGIENVLK